MFVVRDIGELLRAGGVEQLKRKQPKSVDSNKLDGAKVTLETPLKVYARSRRSLARPLVRKRQPIDQPPRRVEGTSERVYLNERYSGLGRPHSRKSPAVTAQRSRKETSWELGSDPSMML